MSPVSSILGRWLSRFLSKPRKHETHIATSNPALLAATLQKGDVLLVEGNSRFSTAIKYLTQSSWSHSALYIADALGSPEPGREARVLIDSDINEGVRAIPLSEFSNFHTRVCRPVGLSPDEINQIVRFALSKLGHQYDLKNIVDLARYLIQKPPVPRRWKRKMLSIGSGDPTKAICSSLIAEAFQAVNYPILPQIITDKSKNSEDYQEYLEIRHHSLFAPRDFDVSPYFKIVKPMIEQGFDPHQLNWK